MNVLSAERLGRITGSRVAAVIGVDPYRTAHDVMREMVRQGLGAETEFKGNPATRWGVDHEQDGIFEYERSSGAEVVRQQEFSIHPDYPFLGATPDGWIYEPARACIDIIEVKAPWKATYTHISQRPDYAAQIQLQLACSGADACVFVVWRTDGISVSRVESDPWWLESHLPTLKLFMAEYERIVTDPELAAPYLTDLQAERDDDQWAEAASEYLDACLAVDAAKSVQEAAKDRLITLRLAEPELPAKGAGVTLIQSRPRKTTSWKDAVVTLVPDADLTPFTKESAEVSWSVRRSGAA